jgi:hypothetical protein
MLDKELQDGFIVEEEESSEIIEEKNSEETETIDEKTLENSKEPGHEKVDIEANKNDQSINFKKIAILQGINKITTETSNLRIPVNNSVKFGNLLIRVNACWKAPVDAKPENKILLRISEKIPNDGSEKDVFYGWMLSSSPAISSITHPVYDIIAINCLSE